MLEGPTSETPPDSREEPDDGARIQLVHSNSKKMAIMQNISFLCKQVKSISGIM